MDRYFCIPPIREKNLESGFLGGDFELPCRHHDNRVDRFVSIGKVGSSQNIPDSRRFHLGLRLLDNVATLMTISIAEQRRTNLRIQLWANAHSG